MTTLIGQRSRGFWAALAVGIVTGAVLNGMSHPQFALADADTNNGDKFAQLTAQLEQLQSDFTDTQVDLAGTQDALTKSQTELAEALATIEDLVEAQQETDEVLIAVAGTLEHVSVQDGEINGLAGPHVIFEGCNVHVRSGSGATNDWGAPSGLGNLILGYNEFDSGADRSGAHNLVIGPAHAYCSVGGLVAGIHNSITNECATITGGANNTASGYGSTVSGGWINEASNNWSVVSGGGQNTASGEFSTVSGGIDNEASAGFATVSGGASNLADGEDEHVP